MEKSRSYYYDLNTYTIYVDPWDYDAFETITRMVNNPCIIAKQELLDYDYGKGKYVIKVTNDILDVMKKVVKINAIIKE